MLFLLGHLTWPPGRNPSWLCSKLHSEGRRILMPERTLVVLWIRKLPGSSEATGSDWKNGDPETRWLTVLAKPWCHFTGSELPATSGGGAFWGGPHGATTVSSPTCSRGFHTREPRLRTDSWRQRGGNRNEPTVLFGSSVLNINLNTDVLFPENVLLISEGWIVVLKTVLSELFVSS